MNHALPAARPVHTVLLCTILFGGALVVQAMSAMSTPVDPWVGLARSSERTSAAVEAFAPCERALEAANAIRVAGTGASPAATVAQRACGGIGPAVEAARLARSCALAAGAASQAAADLSRGVDAGKAVVRYRAARTKCLSEAATWAAP